MSLTKQDIDALVDGIDYDAPIRICSSCGGGDAIPWGEIHRTLYLAAGLTARGERKPERVRCWSYRYNGAGPYVSSLDPNGSDFAADITPGYFIPDGDADAR